MMNEASIVMDVAKAKEKDAEDKILLEKERGREELRRDRKASSRKLTHVKNKHEATIKELCEKHESVLRANEKKYNKRKVRLVHV